MRLMGRLAYTGCREFEDRRVQMAQKCFATSPEAALCRRLETTVSRRQMAGWRLARDLLL